MDIITRLQVNLDDIHFHAHHGLLPQERTVGNEFAVDLSVTLGEERSSDYSSVDKTISYADLYEIIRQEMNRPQDLLEHVAHNIASRICNAYSSVSEGNIRISKLTPPIPAIDGSASVKLFFKKNAEKFGESEN